MFQMIPSLGLTPIESAFRTYAIGTIRAYEDSDLVPASFGARWEREHGPITTPALLDLAISQGRAEQQIAQGPRAWDTPATPYPDSYAGRRWSLFKPLTFFREVAQRINGRMVAGYDLDLDHPGAPLLFSAAIADTPFETVRQGGRFTADRAQRVATLQLDATDVAINPFVAPAGLREHQRVALSVAAARDPAAAVGVLADLEARGVPLARLGPRDTRAVFTKWLPDYQADYLTASFGGAFRAEQPNILGWVPEAAGNVVSSDPLYSPDDESSPSYRWAMGDITGMPLETKRAMMAMGLPFGAGRPVGAESLTATEGSARTPKGPSGRTGPGDTERASRQRAVRSDEPPDQPAVFRALRAQESTRDDERNRAGSSAMGRYQFTDETWLSFARANPQLFRGMDTRQILEARADGATMEVAVRWYADQNARALRAAGLEANDATVMLAHFAGPGRARRILQAAAVDPSEPIQKFFDGDAFSKNEGLWKKHNISTVEDLMRYFTERYGTGETFSAPLPEGWYARNTKIGSS